MDQKSKCKKLNPKSTAAAKLLQSCLTLCDPIDGRPPGSAVPGILQARTRVGLKVLEDKKLILESAWRRPLKILHKLQKPKRKD